MQQSVKQSPAGPKAPEAPRNGKVFVFRKPPSQKSVGHYFKKWIVNPVIFLVVSGVILVVPSSLYPYLSRRRLALVMQNFLIRLVDITIATVALIGSIPFFIVIPILIKLDSPGPVFYKQMRTGVDRRRRDRRVAGLGRGKNRRRKERRSRTLYGKPFYIYKFRTMKVSAEDDSGAVWARQDDPRVTKVGKWLRMWHLDEIPQFFNVLKGDMSVVGPRPERPEIIGDLLKHIPEYRKRLVVKPGITGPAQVFLGYDSCMEDIKRKIRFDDIYISNRSLRLMFLILALTAVKIFSNMIEVKAGFFNLNLTLKEDSTSEDVKFSY